MEYIFKSDFYVKFKPPNADELISKLDGVDLKLANTSVFMWGELCKVDRISLNIDDWMNDIIPILNNFSKEMNYTDGYFVENPWINLYHKGSFQEAHDHYPSDLALVFFINTGKNFSNFYFYDKLRSSLTPNISDLLYNIGYNPTKIIDVEAGDAIIFPSNILHGVSPHNSDIIRKTLSTNIKLTK